MTRRWSWLYFTLVGLVLACQTGKPQQGDSDAAGRFVAAAERESEDRAQEYYAAEFWRHVEPSEKAEGHASELKARYEEFAQRAASNARQHASQDPIIGRKLYLLRRSADGVLAEPRARARLTQISNELEQRFEALCVTVYDQKPCLKRPEVEAQIASNRDPEQLKRLWTAWYDAAAGQSTLYAELMALKNHGARDTGFRDAAELAQSAQEIPPADLTRQLDALWQDLRPLYQRFHAYVRVRLREKYGPHVVAENGPIPAHLLGNLWAQEWEGIAELYSPPEASKDIATLLKEKKVTPQQMLRYGQRFFESLGFPPLPEAFHRNSIIEARGRMGCHPTAWNLSASDWRLTMCLTPTPQNFFTVHHELGHIEYYRAMRAQSFLFRDTINPGINESIGDAVALSVTPQYLARINLVADEPSAQIDYGYLLRVAGRKLARIPFGLALEKWRWEVSEGKITPERYSARWWELMREYQGVVPPVSRPVNAFDPGAKYHVAADMGYTRYVLADVLAFDIHRGMAEAAGCARPLHECSVYESKAAGNRLQGALALGNSVPWPEVLQKLAGTSRISAQGLLSYLAPLSSWLERETKNQPVGW